MKRFKLVCCSDSGAVAGGFPPFHSFFVATPANPATSFSVGKGMEAEPVHFLLRIQCRDRLDDQQ